MNQIINNQNLNNQKIECSNFNGNLEIFLMNGKSFSKNDYGFIFEDISDISNEFKKALNNERKTTAKNTIIGAGIGAGIGYGIEKATKGKGLKFGRFNLKIG